MTDHATHADAAEFDTRAGADMICVLGPWPILTVTIEQSSPGGDDIYLHAGGQGFWVARMIVNLGGHPILCEPLTALSGGISFLNISHTELIEAGYCSSSERSAIIGGIRSLQSSGARNIVVSRAGEPAIAMLDGRLVEVEPPHFRPLDYRGAGDSMTAALALAQARGLAPDVSLRLAAAAGAVNTTRHGLGTGGLEDIEAIAGRVVIRDLDGGS